MKNIFLFLTLLGSLASCNVQYVEKDIIGSWQVTNLKSNIKDISPTLVDGATKEALSSVYTFKENGECHMISAYVSDGQNGIFEILSESNSVFMKYGDSYKYFEEYVIVSVSKDVMVWKKETTEMGSFTMTLNKIKAHNN